MGFGVFTWRTEKSTVMRIMRNVQVLPDKIFFALSLVRN